MGYLVLYEISTRNSIKSRLMKVLQTIRKKHSTFMCLVMSSPNSLMHSFSSLSYDRSKASSKASSPKSAIQSFLLQMRVSFLSLRSSSSFLRLLPRFPFTSIPAFIFPLITRCRRQFLCKKILIHLPFRLLISCRIFFCSLNLSNTSSFLS